MPEISVVLPVYNCDKFIFEAIQSVLNQSYTKYEVIIIDDCSTDKTVEIIKGFKDARIKLIVKEKNTGYTDSLNYAISIAKGKYIARMDGDDICLPCRFEKQIAFLESNKNVILCGSGIQIIGTDTILHHPSSHDEIKVKLCFGSSFYHPTVMGRKEFFIKNPYNRNLEPAEDYDLWTRLAFQGELANLEEVLLVYRVHENQVSQVMNKYQTTVGYSSQNRMFERLVKTDKNRLELLHNIFKTQQNYTTADFKKALIFILLLQKNNKKLGVYSKEIFAKALENKKNTFLKNYFRAEKVNLNKVMIYFRHLTFLDVFRLFKFRYFKN
jgi:glycosyltransferase involved in cell wall biosynthesis